MTCKVTLLILSWFSWSKYKCVCVCVSLAKLYTNYPNKQTVHKTCSLEMLFQNNNIDISTDTRLRNADRRSKHQRCGRMSMTKINIYWEIKSDIKKYLKLKLKKRKISETIKFINRCYKSNVVPKFASKFVL